MQVANIADATSITEHGLGVFLTIFLVGLAPGIPIALWWMFRTPKFRGPAVTGTAQVLSLRRIGTMSENSMIPQVMCRIRLRVELPGSEAYEVKLWKGWSPWNMDAPFSQAAPSE